ncbi:MAG: hypothetical protein AAF915_01945 [Cyanobacteria bacterium P01_D01_bin.50]
MNDKELMLLKMKVIYTKAQTWNIEELALALEHLSEDCWSRVSKNYPASFRINS